MSVEETLRYPGTWNSKQEEFLKGLYREDLDSVRAYRTIVRKFKGSVEEIPEDIYNVSKLTHAIPVKNTVLYEDGTQVEEIAEDPLFENEEQLVEHLRELESGDIARVCEEVDHSTQEVSVSVKLHPLLEDREKLVSEIDKVLERSY